MAIYLKDLCVLRKKESVASTLGILFVILQRLATGILNLNAVK